MTGTTLVISLDDGRKVDTVNLVDSSGETVAVQPVPQGTTKVMFELLGETNDGYRPDTYSVIAAGENESIDEETVLLEPELTISAVKWAKNHPAMDWDKDEPTWEDHAAFVVENTGTAPSFLQSVQWTDAPLCRVKGRNMMEFHHNVLLPAGESTTIYSPAAIYQTEGETFGRDLKCENLDTGQLTVTAIVQAGENPSYSQTIEYGGRTYDCELSIVEGNAKNASLRGGDA